MRALLLLALVAGPVAAPAAAPAAAQVPPAELGARHVPAPWWMREPVIASRGAVRAELPANRANLSAQFTEVERTAAEATRKAAARVEALDVALKRFGADRARLTTNFSTQPLYEQVRNREGQLETNARPDQIERYATTAQIDLEVRDIAILEQAYALVVAARPTGLGRVGFRLQPDNATLSWLQTEAVKDAAWRAREAAVAAGARLGPARIIDPGGRVCQTDVLAGWPSYTAGAAPTLVEVPDSLSVSASRAPAPPPPPPPPPPAPAASGDAALPFQATLQPPMQEIRDAACVVYLLQP